METTQQPERKDPIGSLVIKHLLTFEIILILNIILASFIKSKEPTLGEILMILSFVVLVLLYVLKAVKDKGSGNGIAKFGQRLGYFALGITVMGIYFKIMHWQGTNYIILSGTLLLAIGIIMASLASIKTWNQKLTFLVVRGMLAIIIASVLLQTI